MFPRSHVSVNDRVEMTLGILAQSLSSADSTESHLRHRGTEQFTVHLQGNDRFSSVVADECFAFRCRRGLSLGASHVLYHQAVPLAREFCIYKTSS